MLHLHPPQKKPLCSQRSFQLSNLIIHFFIYFELTSVNYFEELGLRQATR